MATGWNETTASVDAGCMDGGCMDGGCMDGGCMDTAASVDAGYRDRKQPPAWTLAA